MKLLIAFLFLPLTAICQLKADSFPVSQWGARCYALAYTPTTYNTTTKSYPLIVFLHGAGETGTTTATLSKLTGNGLMQRISQGWVPSAVHPVTNVADTFIVIAPQAASWSFSYEQLKFMMPDLLRKYRVDRNRIYLTGLSAGGGGTFSTFGSRDSAFISLFAAMATASSAGTNASNGYTSVQVETGLKFGSRFGVKMWTVAGEQDYLLNTDVRYHDSTNWNDPVPKNKLTVIAGVGHSSWNQMYNPSFRPTINYYGKTGTCNNGCNNGGIGVAPNNNGSPVRGSGRTQDSLNLYEWFLLNARNAVTLPSAPAEPVLQVNDVTITFPTTMCVTVTANMPSTFTLVSNHVISPSLEVISPERVRLSYLFPGKYTLQAKAGNQIVYSTVTVNCVCTE